jgi:hypothetical protein
VDPADTFSYCPLQRKWCRWLMLRGGAWRCNPPEGLLELATPSSVRRQRKENRGQRERRRMRPKGSRRQSLVPRL